MNRAQTGFTLLELLIALAITAVVATAAIAALNVFADADTTATRRMDRDADTDRALQLLRRDVADLRALGVRAHPVGAVRRPAPPGRAGQGGPRSGGPAPPPTRGASSCRATACC